MSESRIPTILVRDVLWRRLDEPSFEHCRVSELPDAFTIQGCVLTVADNQPFQVQYVVQCDLDWVTRLTYIQTIHGESYRRLELRRDESGTWWRDEERAPEFDGLVDIDLAVSPSTNTLPIRRLALSIGDGASTDAVWVRFPELDLERLSQQYTRVDAYRYTYESGDGAFTADLDVDGEGVVVRYGRLWERISG